MNSTAGAGVTERQSDWTVDSLIDDFIADGKLSRRKLAYLDQWYDRCVEELPMAWSFDIAGSMYCTEMEIPQGSYWCQVAAAVLDFLSPRSREDGGSRLVEITKELSLCGHIDPEDLEWLDR